MSLITGCVDQKKEVSYYRKILDAHAPATQPFVTDQPLSLREALALANHNEQLASTGEDYVHALIAKNRAAAAFFPTVSLAPSYAIFGSPSLGGTRAGSANHQWQVPVVGSINVFRGLGDVANVKAAEATIAQHRDLLLDLQATILLNTAQVYYQVLRSEQQTEVLTNSLKVQQARVKDMEQQFNNGLATRLEVAQTQAQADATAVQLVSARNDVANGRATLARLLSVYDVNGPLRDDFPQPDHIDARIHFEDLALDLREDLRAAHAAIAAAKESVNAAVAQYYPSVSINTAAFLYPENFVDAKRWNAMLLVNLPIFTAGLIEADVRDAWANLRQAALNESMIRHQALSDVQTAYNNFTSNTETIRNLQSQVDASQEAYDQARDLFRNGLAINLDVLTAQDQLLNSQLQLTSAHFDRTVFYLDLLRASGQLTFQHPSLRTATSHPATAPTTHP